uniref:Uncharacterized protein n=1 Tax=Magnetococcus massalia (strain MO-1) TaxID=451514 RepID=A0A1S7LGM7_MAGMO|nr:Protein of unknown function [Candidatus Magnetococcus massalia]
MNPRFAIQEILSKCRTDLVLITQLIQISNFFVLHLMFHAVNTATVIHDDDLPLPAYKTNTP